MAAYAINQEGMVVIPTYQRITFNLNNYKDNYEEAFWKIREGRVLLKMLTTLSVPGIVYKWLPNARFTSDGKYIHCSPYRIVIRQHFKDSETTTKRIRGRNRELISLVFHLKNAIDMMKAGSELTPGLQQKFESEYGQFFQTLNGMSLAVSEHLKYIKNNGVEFYKYENNVGDVVFESFMPPKPPSLLDLYMTENSMTDRKKAVANLEEILELAPDDIFSEPCLDKRRNWYQDRAFVMICNMHCVTDDYVINTSNTKDYFSQEIQVLGLPLNPRLPAPYFYIAMNAKTIFPLTIWCKENSKKKYALPILPSPPYPFWNDNILSSGNQEIYLTEAFKFAILCNVVENEDSVSSFLISWYGGQRTIKYMNWDVFIGKTVKYVFTDNSVESVSIAARVYNILLERKVNIKFYKFCDLRRPIGAPIGQKWETCDKLLDYEEIKDKIKDHNTNKFPIAPVEDFPAIVKMLTGKDIESFTIDFSQAPPTPKKDKEKPSYKLISDSTITEYPKYLQAPVIAEKTISLIYSEPGIGKTWLALSCAYATSLGLGALKGWKGTGRKRKVLYIDSEMGEIELKKRLQVMERLYKTPLTENPHFKCISLDLSEISLSDIDGQAEIDRFISSEMDAKSQDKPLIVIDNVLAVTEYSDHPKTWNSLFRWIRDMRDDGATVLVIHHTNESGRQRGSGIKKAVVDNVFRVTKAQDSDTSSLGLNIQIEKGRGIPTDVQKNFSLKFFPSTKNPRWENTAYKISKEELTERVICMTKEKKSVNEIMKETGFSKAKIQLVRRDAGLQRGYKRKQNGNGSENQPSDVGDSEAASLDSDIM